MLSASSSWVDAWIQIKCITDLVDELSTLFTSQSDSQ